MLICSLADRCTEEQCAGHTGASEYARSILVCPWDTSKFHHVKIVWRPHFVYLMEKAIEKEKTK